MVQHGLLSGGEKLSDNGGLQLRLRAGQALLSDGPYADAHYVIGGCRAAKWSARRLAP